MPPQPRAAVQRRLRSNSLQHFRKHIFDGARHDLKNLKPRSNCRREAIACHQLYLISSNWWAREKFGHVPDRVPESEGTGQQKGFVSCRGRERFQQRSVGINARASQLVDLMGNLYLQYSSARLADVLDIGRLNSRAAISKHREYRQAS